MNKRDKRIIYLLMSILFVAVIAFAATYAYLAVREERKGTFDIKLRSKGIDTFTISPVKNANLKVDFSNFNITSGHDVSDDAIIDVLLSTNKEKSSEYCYKIYLDLPDTKVFSYNVEGRPELILNVQKSINKDKYINIIKDMDITTIAGEIYIPVSENSSDYLHKISTTKGVNKNNQIRATVTFKYFPDVYQILNDEKHYSASLNIELVNCLDGKKYN